MIRKRIPLLFGLLLAFGASLSAAQIYILYDAACMDRLEFDHDRPEGRADYMVYHVNIRSGEKIILEVGEESGQEQNYLPEQFLSCASGGFDQGLMRRINTNIDQVYMVYAKNNRKYIISPIKTAALYRKQGSVISYESPKYHFRLDTEYGTIGEDISVNMPGAKLYFEGRLDNSCTGAYLFRQLAPRSAYPVTDLVLTPEIGITGERSGANAAAALQNSMALQRINGRSMDRYLQEACGTEPGSRGALLTSARTATATTPTSFNTAGGRLNVPTQTGSLPSGAIVPGGNPAPATAMVNRSPAAAAVPAGEPTAAANPPTHTVERGETLYGISRKYSVSVADIKSWNNMSSNTIRRGQVLQVAAPAAATAQATAAPANTFAVRGTTTRTASPTVPNAATRVSEPVPYNQPSNRIMTENTPAEGTHVVQAGETVASVALQYGYTSKRFREMNDLGPNDYVRVGQRLKTSDCNCPATAAPATVAAPVTSAPAAAPTSYGSTGGRIAPNNLTARTPVVPNAPVIAPAATGTSVRNTSSANFGSPTVPRAARSNASPATVSTMPRTTAAPRTSMSNLESNGSRAIGNSTDFGEPIPPVTTTSRGAASAPTSYGTGSYNTRTYNTAPATTSYNLRNGEPMPQAYDYRPVPTPSSVSPYPTPNAPIDYNEVVRQPDSYYRGSSSQRRVHVVSSGESLFGIAKRYNTTVQRLQQVNSLGPNDPIIEYQTLYID
ncbi:MAG: LysM peptidoglycan-binding domain-containing protein [Bacteroidota bacterium]